MANLNKEIIEYRHYSVPIDFPIILLSGDRWKISDIKSDRLHFHNCLEIGLCHSDSGTIEIEGKQLSFKSGDVTCIPRYLPHTTYSTKNTASRWSYIFFAPEEIFKGQFFEADDHFEAPVSAIKIRDYILTKENHPKINSLLSTIVEELTQQDLHYKESVVGLLSALYIELLRVYTKNIANSTPSISHPDKTNFSLLPAIEFIHKNYMKAITIKDLAQLCHLSETHFRRTFHQIMGTTPSAFITSTRIDEACKLLRSTDYTILSISERVGFNSISSFNRHFSSLMKESPRNWRKTLLMEQAQTAKASILEFTGWV